MLYAQSEASFSNKIFQLPIKKKKKQKALTQMSDDGQL